MTEKQALVELGLLLEDECECGVCSLKVAYHDSKRCKYRMKAWTLGRNQPVLRAITGGLYDAVTESLAA